ncbi:N-alpha-acetyltransferase 25, NatB auxiliary subunit-like [Liolophura sinensis]|uniref:N-alpha-acetyltransferase 25, NatB auxiliary subunit-like n=1 Tax=Liolophura sinensis TaxID=3198878 RepID=UPI00315858AE
MASRSHVDVNERRLRPIYDCLDNGNNKKAIQEAEKVLRKQKDFQCAKVLKALALLRLGRHDESSGFLQEVHAQHPTDEATLHAMAICYREVHKLDLIVDLYENAFKGRPDNEEILSALFMAYVRQGDYKKQQQTAMVLHKLRPNKNPYYFWAVMSIVMQAHSTKDKKLSHTMFLPLAERMTQKYVKEEKIEAEAEVQMYLIILELLGHTEEALRVIQSPLGEKLVSELHFVSKKSADLLCKLERWPEANVACKENLIRDPDDWQNWLGYLQAVFSLIDSQWTPSEDSSEKIDHTLDMAIQFVHQDVKKYVQDGRLRRGPYLAELELLKRLQQKNCKDITKLGTPLDLCQKFFELFGDKNSCFNDLKMFIDLLTDEDQIMFLDNIWKTLELGPDVDGGVVYAQSVKQMYRHMTYLQLKRFMRGAPKMSSEEKLKLSQELISRHKEGLQFGRDLLSTDLQYSDNYLVLAVHFMMDVWKATGNDSLVWQMILHLEKGVKHSPSNFQFKLLLVQLYCRMGVFGPCPALYDAMEIKHIMNDTMAHILFNHVGRLGHVMSACAMYGTMLRFFTVNHKETAEYLISSYKYGSFTKIFEFVKFREKLQNSLQFATATAERLVLDLVLETNSHNSTEQMMSYMEIDPEKDKTDFDELCDNRDFTVMLTWDPPHLINLEEIKLKSFEEEKAWLKLRNLQLRILAAAISLGKSSTSHDHANNGVNDNSKPSMTQVLHTLFSQLKSHLEACQQQFATPADYPLQGPFRTRLSSYLSGLHSKLFIEMVENVFYCQTLREEGLERIDSTLEERLRTSAGGLVNELVWSQDCKLILQEDSGCSLHHEVIEQFVMSAESLAHATVLAGVCHRLLKPLKTAFTKKQKKKKDSSLPVPVSFGNFTQLVEGLEKGAQGLHVASQNLDPVFLSLDMANLNLSAPVSDSEDDQHASQEMWKGVESSYQQTAKQMSEFLHTKLHYLNSLRL